MNKQLTFLSKTLVVGFFLIPIILIDACKEKPKPPTQEFTFEAAVTYTNGDQDTLTITSKPTTSKDANLALDDNGCLYVQFSDVLFSDVLQIYPKNEVCSVRKFSELGKIVKEIPNK